LIKIKLTCEEICAEWKILYKTILVLYRYRDFLVGIFYFDSPYMCCFMSRTNVCLSLIVVVSYQSVS